MDTTARQLGTFIPKENGADLIVLKELIEAGKVTPVIDKTYPLSEARSHPVFGRGTRSRRGRHHRLRRGVHEETLLLNVSRNRPTLTICPRPQP